MSQVEAFSAAEVIAAKRDHHALTDPQIDWVIDAYTRGAVADEQMSALLMAILLNGMDLREISRWTDAMINSGERMNWSALSRPTVDKHSTGGVGDKITLPLAPLVAACPTANDLTDMAKVQSLEAVHKLLTGWDIEEKHALQSDTRGALIDFDALVRAFARCKV